MWFLPSYSPGMNLMKGAFSKAKAPSKKAAARTKEALIEAIAESSAAVTLEDARGWYAHSGHAARHRSL